MYLNSWNNITLICGNHKGRDNIEMKLQQGPHSLFYACPEYKSIYGDHHDGRSCNNRLTLVDYEDMLNFLMHKANLDGGLFEGESKGTKMEQKGYSF